MGEPAPRPPRRGDQPRIAPEPAVVRLVATLVAALVAALVAGCGTTAATTTTTSELTVFATASLRTAAEDLERAWEAAAPGRQLTLATGSSAALRVQIEQGAPADVFLSADLDNPGALSRQGLAREPVAFAASGLVVVVPLDNPARVERAADLARDGVRVIAAGDEVPITRYAAQALERLAALEEDPAAFTAAYRRNVASREDNVRAVLAKVELGEGDAAIVYATDARSSDTVRAIPLPAEAQVAVTYGAVVLAGPDEASARRFVDWLVAPDARRILADHGFRPAP